MNKITILEVSTQCGLEKNEAIKQEYFCERILTEENILQWGDYMLNNHKKYCLFCDEYGNALTIQQIKNIIKQLKGEKK